MIISRYQREKAYFSPHLTDTQVLNIDVYERKRAARGLQQVIESSINF